MHWPLPRCQVSGVRCHVPGARLCYLTYVYAVPCTIGSSPIRLVSLATRGEAGVVLSRRHSHGRMRGATTPSRRVPDEAALPRTRQNYLVAFR